MKLFAVLALFAAPAFAAPQIALTFDDLPSHAPLPPGVTRIDVARQTISALQAAKVPPATGLVNAAALESEPQSAPVLRLWRQAGFPLGNHTFSHMNLAQHTVDEYQTEILRNEPVLAEHAAGTDWHWFRYPFLSEGETPEKRAAVRSFLAAHGYKLATVTMMFGDWLYSEPYARCMARNDHAAVSEMEKDYLDAAGQGIGYYRALSSSLYGRDIPYVLLLHIGAFEARTLPKLLDLYRSRGFEFVSLEQAMRDPYYEGFVDPGRPAPPADLEHRLDADKLAKIAKPTNYAPALEKMCR
jgi:peptidoglycan/xylan/chitin deacetylase (PgdA/CDA1 family)